MRRRALLTGLVVLAALAGIILVVALVRRPTEVVSGSPPAHPGGAASETPATFPLREKPAPVAIAFDGCTPTGRGGDPALNLLKNRVDSARWVPVPFERILSLPWPREAEDRPRRAWPARARGEVAQWEGSPVSVEGYIAWARESGPESTNCGRKDNEHVDWHVWLVDERGAGRDRRERAIIAEPTPAVRTNHPGWTLSRLRATGMTGTRVRISGWLLLDQEHPEQVGRTRGTIWEIHPVMGIDVLTGGRWVPLDRLGPGDLPLEGATRSRHRR